MDEEDEWFDDPEVFWIDRWIEDDEDEEIEEEDDE